MNRINNLSDQEEMLIIILLLFAVVILMAIAPIENARINNALYLLLMLLFVIIAGFRDGTAVRDYFNYIDMFHNYENIFVEPSFVLISSALHHYFLPESLYLFLIFAFAGVFLKFTAIRQLTEHWVLSILVYLGWFFILHEMTQIRVGVASGFLLLCIKPMYERDWKKFLLFSTLAISFHYSAFIILPLWFFNTTKINKILLFIAIPLSYLIYFSGIDIIASIPIPAIEEKIQLYKAAQELGLEGFNEINVFNAIHVLNIIIYYILIIKLDLISRYNKYTTLLIKIYAVSLMSLPIFSFMPVLGFRISELYGVVAIILIPFLCYIFSPRVMSRMIVVFISASLLFTAVFYSKLILI